MTEELAQAAPALRLRAVDGGANAVGAEAQQRFRRLAVVSQDEGHRRDCRELPNESRHSRELGPGTAMHRDHQGIDPPATRRAQQLARRIRMQRSETPVAGGINPGALGLRQQCAHGDHIGESISRHGQPRINVT